MQARRRPAGDHHRKRHEPKIAADGAFGGVQLLNYRALPHITHVHSLSIHPTCNGMQPIELNLQTGSRECMFTARNESISASCRKMRFFANNFSDIQPRPGFNQKFGISTGYYAVDRTGLADWVERTRVFVSKSGQNRPSPQKQVFQCYLER